MRALRVRIDDLTPAEYGALDSWDYEEILLCQREWHEAQRLYPPGWNEHRKVTPEAESGPAGPQLVG